MNTQGNSTQAHSDELSEVSHARELLNNTLLTSLDLELTLANFFQIAQPLMRLEGMRYHFDARAVRCEFGTVSELQATYQLKIAEAPLGALKFFRKERFIESELETLETLTAILVHPLRNALLYRDAVENSLRDPLTQIGNRAAMELTLQREMGLIDRTCETLSVLVIDIDHFKSVNDTAGHSFGDTVIRAVAQSIANTLRQTDQVFRFGGEEFVVVLSDSSHRAALMIGERVRRAVESVAVPYPQGPGTVTVSIGVASSRAGDTRDSLVDRADCALYLAKMTGRNRVVSQSLEGELPDTMHKADYTSAR